MSSVSIVITQYFASAAGYTLTSDGRLVHGDTTVFQTNVNQGRIPSDAHYAILDRVAERVKDRAALSVRYATSLDIDRLGTLALACKAAPTAGGMLQRVARFQTLLSDSVRYHLDAHGPDTFLRQELLAGSGPGRVFSPEAGLSVLFYTVNQLATEVVTPIRVTFQHSAPKDAPVFEEFFGCTVMFGADADGILFSQDSLETENRLGDQALSNFLTSHLETELAQINALPPLVRTTKEEIARVLSEGLPKMADVAQSLGFSARSFHRRLADHGVSFQTLAGETRREIAVSMLRDQNCPLSEIAFLTGFSEQSAFNRAFKRWTDQTPANYRRSLTA